MIPGSFLKDGINLNPEGQRIIAETIYKTLGK